MGAVACWFWFVFSSVGYPSFVVVSGVLSVLRWSVFKLLCHRCVRGARGRLSTVLFGSDLISRRARYLAKGSAY